MGWGEDTNAPFQYTAGHPLEYRCSSLPWCLQWQEGHGSHLVQGEQQDGTPAEVSFV